MTHGADVVTLLPETVLALAAVVGLAAGTWLPRRRQGAVRLVVGAGAVAGIVLALLAPTPATAFGGSVVVDVPTTVVRVVVLAVTVVVLVLAGDGSGRGGGAPPGDGAEGRAFGGDARETELAVLVALAAVGVMLLAGAHDLLLLAAAALLVSAPLAAVTGLRRDARGTEAALKFLFSGALAGLAMLAGIAVLYGLGRATAYPALAAGLSAAPGRASAIAAGVAVVAVLGGLLFEVGGVPAHFWVPDAVDGTPPVTGAVLTTLGKVGGLVAMARLLVEAVPVAAVPWPLLVAVLAAATMTLGNLAAFAQTSLRRLLAYSTVSQVGYLLVPVAVAGRTPLATPALLAYLAAYAVTNLAVFAALAARPGALELADVRGLARRRPGLAVATTVGLLGLVGTPPSVVFVGKLAAFAAAVDGGMAWLAAVAVLNSVASLFYYLRWIAPLYAEPERPGPLREPLARRARAAAVVLAVVSVVGVAAGPALVVLG